MMNIKKTIRKPLAWVLALLSLIYIAQRSTYTFDSFNGSEQRSISVLDSVSETVEGMPTKPENLPGKSFPTCDVEIDFIVARDEFFASLTPKTMPHPFPIDTFPIEIITKHQCQALSNLGDQKNMLNSDVASVLFHIEAYKDFDMVKRTVKRLSFEDHHGFVVHVATDVSEEYIDLLIALSEEYTESPICVARGGYIKWLTSTDIRILFSSMQWLKSFSPFWDFFVSLSGADYSIMDGPTLNKELVAEGPVSWIPRMNKDEWRDIDKFPHSERFLNYGLSCQETQEIVDPGKGRTFWLQKLVPELGIGYQDPLSSGGIWHRSMVDFLINDDRARAAYMYFSLFPCAGVEHYWQTLYTLPELEPMLIAREPARMFWVLGRGVDGVHNTFITMNFWDKEVKPAIDKRIPFIRKFDSEKEKDVLDRIDEYSAEVFYKEEAKQIKSKRKHKAVAVA